MKVEIQSEFIRVVPLSRKYKVYWKAYGAAETGIGTSHEVQIQQLHGCG